MQKSAANLTLVEKIGQMIMVGLDGTEAESDIIELIQTYRIGGIILKHKNMNKLAQTLQLINTLKAANFGNSVPLFIATSQEPGRGSELPKDIRRFPSVKYIAENADKNVLGEVQSITASILKKIGINMNFSPLLDMGGMVEGVPLGDRIISATNPTFVGNFGLQTINAHQNNGVICVPKYFPSHTSTKGDRSNMTIPHTKKSLSKLEQFDLIPFKNVIDEGAEAMLIGNIHVSKFNLFAPATMSSKVVTKLLKNKYEFKGIAVADDICSTCIKVQYGVKDAAKKAIMAGNDMVIIGDAKSAKGVLEYIEKQVVKGTLDEQGIELCAQKVLDLKLKYNLNDNEIESVDFSSENERIAELLKIMNK